MTEGPLWLVESLPRVLDWRDRTLLMSRWDMLPRVGREASSREDVKSLRTHRGCSWSVGIIKVYRDGEAWLIGCRTGIEGTYRRTERLSWLNLTLNMKRKLWVSLLTPCANSLGTIHIKNHQLIPKTPYYPTGKTTKLSLRHGFNLFTDHLN